MPCAELAQLVALIPVLGEAEFKTLALLTSWSEATGTVSASSRALESASKLSRSNVRRALHSLAERGLIESERGSATRAAKHRLLYLVRQVPEVRGLTAGPPPLEGGLTAGPGVGSSQAQGGPFSIPGGGLTVGPPPHGESATYQERTKETRPRAQESIDCVPSAVVDKRIDRQENAPRTFDPATLATRLLRSHPQQFEPEDLETLKNRLWSYRAKFGQPEPPEPDPEIVAEFLSVAPAASLHRLIDQLELERRTPGDSYAWFVTVAAQRLHSIRSHDLKTARDAAKTAYFERKKPPQRETAASWLSGFDSQFKAAVAAKVMR